MLRAVVAILLVLSCAEARVDFAFSKIYDEYDFWGQSSVTLDGLCADTCHIYASITEESRNVASKILIQTSKGFISIADIADRISPGTGGMKSELEISNQPTLTIVNGNAGLAAGPLVLYIVNKAAPNFESAEVYEGNGMARPQAYTKKNTITVMSAAPFTLRQSPAAGGSPVLGVRAGLTGFDAVSGGYDTCVDVFNLKTAPFPGFTFEINGPIVTLLYDYDQYTQQPGEITASVGISNALQLQKAGFFASAGWHGCSAKMFYKSSLYNYISPTQVNLMNETPQNVVLNVMTNADEQHAVEFFAVPTGETARVFQTNSMQLKYFTQDVITSWHQDGIVQYYFMVRYTSNIV
ncbi:hypothetical protein PRIPAC_83080 [Pristionchus pacificus]|uniref:Uncharacterized protein n=1 Tax=Pristionchus pacificus TaxID=54126 RepID=A0A454XV96_PRIPA|nr:hypothetical protein PRIPAC_83080 [Pristionchus pacificus]|eukprot:PDM79735.1 hypothetical protein PRIPAC_32314 [Pristionchus pacificus]